MIYLFKNIIKELFKNKSQMVILFFMAFLTAGMFFFVRFSIDGNEEVISKYVIKQNQEDFRFKVDSSLSDEYKLSIISKYSLDKKDVEKYGVKTVLKRENIDLSDINDNIAYLLSSKYDFEFEKREIFKFTDEKYTYYITNSMKDINITYVIDGTLPINENEIAFPYKYLEINDLKIGNKVFINGNNYVIVGSICLPDYIKFQPFGELQKGYENNTFAIVSDAVFKKHLEKDVVSYYCGKANKGDLDKIINHLQNESAISYIQKASDIESNSAPTIALNSNKSLSLTFLIGLLIISLFVYFLFITKFIQQNRKMIGCMLALGYKKSLIIKTLILGILPCIFLGSILGCIIGGKLSNILVNRYIEVYMFTDFTTKINIDMFLLGVLSLPIIICILIIFIIKKFIDDDVAVLMRTNNTEKRNKKYNKFVTFILSKVKDKNIFSYKTILSKKSSIILTVISMIVVGTLFITSISLYFSSIHVFNKLFEGQAYKYIYKTDNYIDDDSISDSDKFIVKAGRIVNQNNSIINLYGINKKNEYFKLSSSKNDFVVFDEEQVVISKGFSVLYDKKIGDTLIIKIDNNNIELVISDICENGELNNVYMSKSKLANILNISPKVSNTFFSKIEQNINDSSFITIDQQVLAAKYNQNSNKSSAVINQVIGILFSMLMFFLVMILIIQENKENIKILRLLGYKDEAAIRLALGKYRTFISFILIVTMPLSIYISYLVHISISKSTVDYIPFNTNIIVLICLFVMINILYTIIYETFKRKVKVY